MKQKYLDIKKYSYQRENKQEVKEPIVKQDAIQTKYNLSNQHNKYSFSKTRKATKPKNGIRFFQGLDNQTESDGVRYKQIKQLNLQSNKKMEVNANCKVADKKLHKYKQKGQQKQKMYCKSKVSTQQQINEQNFIGELNNYLQKLKTSKHLKASQEKQKMIKQSSSEQEILQKKQLYTNIQTASPSFQKNQISKITKRIKTQKTINRNLQKCIIQIQKVLWDRTNKLQILENQIHKKCSSKPSNSSSIFSNKSVKKQCNYKNLQPKQNQRNSKHNKDDNTIKSSKQAKMQKQILSRNQKYPWQKKKLSKCQDINQMSTISPFFNNDPTNANVLSSSENQKYENNESFTRKSSLYKMDHKNRRKTQAEVQVDIQKLIAKTLGVRKRVSYSKFQKKNLNNLQ